MSDNPKRGSGVWLWLTAIGVISPMLYVLSIGPACWMRDSGILGQNTILNVYAPVIFLYQQNEPFRDALNWYLELWD